MNSIPSPRVHGFRRTLALGCVFAALFAGRALAVTISATFTLPTSNFDSLPTTESNPSIGSFDFSTDPNWGTVSSLGTVGITLRFFGLDTNFPTNSPNPGDGAGLDLNNIFLTLGGANTGIALNGFGNGTNTLSFSAVPSNAATIVNALNSSGGVLSLGLLDINGASTGTNPFALVGGTASLSFVGAEVVPIPFTPVQTMGFALIGAGVAFRQLRRRGSWLAAFMRVRA